MNCLLKNARLVISKEVFELWCEKSMALLKKDGIIGIDEFLYLAPNSIEIEDYVRFRPGFRLGSWLGDPRTKESRKYAKAQKL